MSGLLRERSVKFSPVPRSLFLFVLLPLLVMLGCSDDDDPTTPPDPDPTIDTITVTAVARDVDGEDVPSLFGWTGNRLSIC